MASNLLKVQMEVSTLFLKFKEEVCKHLLEGIENKVAYIKEHNMHFRSYLQEDWREELWKDDKLLGTFRMKFENNNWRFDYEPNN